MAPKYRIQETSIKAITVDHSLQSRVKTDMAVVKDYSDALLNGSIFPPVTVFDDEVTTWLGDGFHRIDAHKAAGRVSILAEIRPGGRREAILYSVGANLKMGVHPTAEDRRKAVIMLLEDPEYQLWSPSEIGERCGVSSHKVRMIRREYESETGIKLPVKVSNGVNGGVRANAGRKPRKFLVNKLLRIASLAKIDPPETPAGIPDLYIPGAVCCIQYHSSVASVCRSVGDVLLWRESIDPTLRAIIVYNPNHAILGVLKLARRLGVEFLTPEEVIAEIEKSGDSPSLTG